MSSSVFTKNHCRLCVLCVVYCFLGRGGGGRGEGGTVHFLADFRKFMVTLVVLLIIESLI